MDIRVAAYAMVVESCSVLLAHWNDMGRSGWTLPGGGIEPGEDPADAAVREVREETGYDVQLDELLGIDSFVIAAEKRISPPGTPMHALRVVYSAHVIGGQLQHEVGGSTDEARWFRLEDVGSLARVPLVDVGLRLAGVSPELRQREGH